MRRVLPVVTLLLLTAVALCFFFLSPRQPASHAPGSMTPSTAAAPPTGAENASTTSSADAAASQTPAPVPAANPVSLQNLNAPPDPGIPPTAVLAGVRSAIRQYGDMFHGNPVGTNPEITSALNGKNPKQINFINPQAGMRINDKGEMIDPWGTPLFFHQVSGTEMEIRSAGPDKMMWTADDIITR